MAGYSKPPPDPRGAHARLYWEIIDSNAWRCLSASDQLAYIGLLRQLRSTNNGDLSFPLSVARHHGIASPATLAKSLRALVAVGLIAVTRKGGCTRRGQRLPTLYRLTDYSAFEVPAKHIDAAKATNEWKAIKNQAMGLALIRQTEELAKKTATNKEIIRLQKLTPTASIDEPVGSLTASKNEVWHDNHTSKSEGRTERENRHGTNGHADFKGFPESPRPDNHTSNSEVLSTVAIPMVNLSMPSISVVVRPACTLIGRMLAQRLAGRSFAHAPVRAAHYANLRTTS